MNQKFPFLEALEPRIAPANFVFTQGANLLSAGDNGYLSDADTEGGSVLLASVKSGKALVYWDAEARQIQGISVSNGVNLDIHGNVYGDIVTNLESSGFLSDSDNNPQNGLDGGRLLASSIQGLRTFAVFDSAGRAQNGDVGRIIAGGAISNVALTGDLSGVYAGDGVYDAMASAALPGGSTKLADGTPDLVYEFVIGANFDSSGVADLSVMRLKMSDAAFASSASINGVTFASGLNPHFFAGDGQPGTNGGHGGSVSRVSFVGAIPDENATGFFAGKSYVISAGDGADALVPAPDSKTTTGGNGGNGGSINGVTELGSSGIAVLYAGFGGDGAGSKGNGGHGGSISNLDLQGGASNYQIITGEGGDGVAGGNGGNTSFVNITSKGQIVLAAPFTQQVVYNPDTEQNEFLRDYFLIDQSSGDMLFVTTNLGGGITGEVFYAAKAAAPVSAIDTNLNGDAYPDVAIAYADGTLGILLNNQNGGFIYTVSDLGFKPVQLIAGDFRGDDGYPELAILSTNSLTTTTRVFLPVEPVTGAESYRYLPDAFQPFVFRKGNLLTAVGGGAPPENLLDDARGLELNYYDLDNPNATDDLILAYADGTLQRIFSLKSNWSTTEKVVINSEIQTIKAPKNMVPGGLRSVEYNYDVDQKLAVVSRAGTAASLINIIKYVKPEPVPPTDPAEPNQTPQEQETTEAEYLVFQQTEPLPIPAGTGTIFQASWISETTNLGDTPTLVVLGSDSEVTKLVSFSYAKDEASQMKQTASTIISDYKVVSFANNSLFVGYANSYIFSMGYSNIAAFYNSELPTDEPKIVLSVFNLPFAPKTLNFQNGDGGKGTTGSGGSGGGFRAINFEVNYAYLRAGDGGTSIEGAGGNGGGFVNAGTFRLNAATINPALAASHYLLIDAGDGASVTGSGKASRGGAGGSISDLTFNSLGSAVLTPDGFVLQRGSVELYAGDGGSSESLSAGNGGNITNTKINVAYDAKLYAGAGGEGRVSDKATGGNGGSIFNLIAGDKDPMKDRKIDNLLLAFAGVGGNSFAAKAGNGGSLTGVTLARFGAATKELKLAAGDGGNSSGLLATAAAGTGGSLSRITAEEIFTGDSVIKPQLIAGHGGSAVNGAGGAGGSISTFRYKGVPLDVTAGDGGDSTGIDGKSAAGAGGSISGLQFNILVGGSISFRAGAGGQGIGASAGGAGGNISNSFFFLNPVSDRTLALSIISGQGGNGASGGNGGSISAISSDVLFSSPDGFLTQNDPIAMRFVAGNGGEGKVGSGGNGGNISFSKALLGITRIHPGSSNPDFLPTDEALRIYAGDGGNGADKGGQGGSILGLRVGNPKTNSLGDPIPFNLLTGARLVAGDGGDGGKGVGGNGGAVSSVRVLVERSGTDPNGNLRVITGDGGASSLDKGGAGGAIQSSYLASVNGNPSKGYAIFAQTGDGGDGGKTGGNGGAFSNVVSSIIGVGMAGSSTPASVYSGVFLAGDGGNGTGSVKSLGGQGGSLQNFSQPKDVFNVINLVQAGSGGSSSSDSVGGAGGNVTNFVSQGYLGTLAVQGTRLGIANPGLISPEIQSVLPNNYQGVFSGNGGQGGTSGANGSITGLSAPAIAAIAASNRGLSFQQAGLVSKIATLFHPGYDQNNNGTYDPGDGFVLASKFDPAKDLVSVDSRIVPTANFTNPNSPSNVLPFVNPN